MPEFMTVWWHCMLMGAFFVFVFWCVYEAVKEYRWRRKMNHIAVMHALSMSGPHQWAWRRKGYIPPLFHEQRVDDDP